MLVQQTNLSKERWRSSNASPPHLHPQPAIASVPAPVAAEPSQALSVTPASAPARGLTRWFQRAWRIAGYVVHGVVTLLFQPPQIFRVRGPGMRDQERHEFENLEVRVQSIRNQIL